MQAVEATGKVRIPVPAPERLPPPPPGTVARDIPGDVPALYAAAGASEALRRLEALTGADMQQLPRPGSGAWI